MAVWGDGGVIWSEDRINGGPPYWIGKADPGKIAGALHEIQRIGFAHTAPTEEFHFGPDSKWINIVVYDGSRKIMDIGSWHELYESKEHLVVTSTGVELLGPRDKQAVLEEQPLEYRLFRQRWRLIKAKLIGLIPEHSRKMDPKEHRPLPW